MPLTSRNLTLLKTLGRAGDIFARAATSGTSSGVTLTKDTEGTVGANIIQVSGTIKDGSAHVIFTAKDPGANATCVVAASSGTARAGEGTNEVWLTPTASGTFKVNVTDAAAELCLVEVRTSNGSIAMIQLTFA